jgi:hypothetical protein
MRAYETSEAEKKRIKLMEFKLNESNDIASKARLAMIKEHKEAQNRLARKGMYESRQSSLKDGSLSDLNKAWNRSRLTDRMS